MIVCSRCLQAIESRGEKLIKKNIEFDDERINDNDEIYCEWCEEFFDYDECMEI